MSGDAPPQTIEVEARAKLNPFLRVLGRRDDGYHELETMILPISLADGVRVHAFADPSMFRTLSLSLEVVGDPELTRGVPLDETNLAMRAAMALADAVRPMGFAEIVLDKRVPSAAGLGGGSADAAAVLRALNALWGAALDDGTLGEIGAGVGSDVPALLAGGPVVARGRGERIEPVADAPAFDWIVATFPFGISAADAFGWWDEDGGICGREPRELFEAVRSGDPDVLGPALSNDLEASVLRRDARVAAVADHLRTAGLPGVVLCGSGPSVAGLLPDGAATASVEDLLTSTGAVAGRPAGRVRSIGGAAR
jgi:4-diphosphocytidyl-2-C-methyl-D-erythritol kinase